MRQLIENPVYMTYEEIDNPKPEPYIHPETQFSLACDSIMYAEGEKR